MEQLVVAFPSLAAWMIVGLLSVAVSVGGMFARRILRHLAEQDRIMQANGDRLDAIKETFNNKLFDIHTVLGDHHARIKSLETIRDYQK